MSWPAIPAFKRALELATGAKELGPDGVILMKMCGCGDKDVFSVAGALGELSRTVRPGAALASLVPNLSCGSALPGG